MDSASTNPLAHSTCELFFLTDLCFTFLWELSVLRFVRMCFP